MSEYTTPLKAGECLRRLKKAVRISEDKKKSDVFTSSGFRLVDIKVTRMMGGKKIVLVIDN